MVSIRYNSPQLEGEKPPASRRSNSLDSGSAPGAAAATSAGGGFGSEKLDKNNRFKKLSLHFYLVL